MRIALITGAAGGLGLASARRLAEDGLTVAVADLHAEAAERAAAALPGKGHIGLGCNVADEDSVRAAFDTVQQCWPASRASSARSPRRGGCPPSTSRCMSGTPCCA